MFIFPFLFFFWAELRLRQRGNGKALRKGSEAPSVLSRGRFQRPAGGGGGGSGGTMLFKPNQRPLLVHNVLLKITLHTPSTVIVPTQMSGGTVQFICGLLPLWVCKSSCSVFLQWLGDGRLGWSWLGRFWMWRLSTPEKPPQWPNTWQQMKKFLWFHTFAKCCWKKKKTFSKLALGSCSITVQIPLTLKTQRCLLVKQTPAATAETWCYNMASSSKYWHNVFLMTTAIHAW